MDKAKIKELMENMKTQYLVIHLKDDDYVLVEKDHKNDLYRTYFFTNTVDDYCQEEEWAYQEIPEYKFVSLSWVLGCF